MSRRPTPNAAERAAPAPRGAAAFGPAQPAAGSAAVKAAKRWEEAHTRVTFHCPLDVLADVEAHVADTGQSKSGVIVDALRVYLSSRRADR